MPDPLFHILTRADWTKARAAGEYRPASLVAEGFVHLSFANQVHSSAARHFAGVADLCVLELDPGELARQGVQVRVEDSHGTGTAFPHAYGAVPIGAVCAVRELAEFSV